MTATSSNAVTVGLLLSGGLDSGVLLTHLLRSGRRVQPFYVQSDLHWQRDELWTLRAFLITLDCDRLEPLVVLDMPLGDLYGHHWSITGKGTPEAGSADAAVYLPGRNALLVVKPALWCALHGIEELALAVLASNPFGDATNEFFRDFQGALGRATGRRVELSRPFGRLQKKDVMELGRGLPLELTFSCIAPIDGVHCGDCNKCEERRHAFCSVGIADPTRYANSETNAAGGNG